MASVAYHDWFWLPFLGKTAIEQAMASPWGRLFENYEQLEPDESGWPSLEPVRSMSA